MSGYRRGGRGTSQWRTRPRMCWTWPGRRGKAFDFRFVDLLGDWRHTFKSIDHAGEDDFEGGVGFDASSMRGFQPINEPDMLMMPDPATSRIDPCTSIPTHYFLCDVCGLVTRERYSRDPRGVAQKAGVYLSEPGHGDTSYFGHGPEFFDFDNVDRGRSVARGLPRAAELGERLDCSGAMDS